MRRRLLLAVCLLLPPLAAACGSSDTGSLTGSGSGPSSWGAQMPGASAVSTTAPDAEAGSPGPTVTSAPTPEQVFSALEPDLVKTCGNCHGITGTLPMAPKWLVGPDRYKTITTYPGIVIPDVSSSLLLTIGDTVQHAGGPGLTDAPPVNLRDQVTAWLEMEAAAIQTAPLAATSPFPIKNGSNAIDISKGGVKGASIAFTAAIDASTITFTEMTITAPASTGLEIIHPIFAIVAPAEAPVTDVADSFSNLDQTVPAGTTQPLGVGLMILDVAATTGKNWSSTDEIEIEFTGLNKVAVGDAGTDGGDSGLSGGCKAVTAYTADAVPAIQMNSCLTCHAGSNPTATAALDMTQVGKDNAAACAQALTRVDLMNPSQSEIILAPTGGIAAHPFKGASATFKTMMLAWITKE